jgi:membrane protein
MNEPSAGDAKGHDATTPREIPKTGWWSIIKRVYASLDAKNLSIVAAGIAFFAMLAIFPGLIALVAVYGLVADPATVQKEIASVQGLIPGEAQHIISTYLTNLVSSNASRLGFGLIISVLFALWSARAGTVSLMEGLNIAYEEQEKRGMIRYQTVALTLTVAMIIFAILALGLIAAVPAVVELAPLGNAIKTIGVIAPWPVLIILSTIGFAAVYRFAPARREAKSRWVTLGGVVATLLWIVGSIGFSFYVQKFGSYDKTFGSLGAVVVLLTWLYLTAYAVLLGACFNAEMERQTARDTTEGPEKPMGKRGAKMADTVAD